MLYAVQYRDMHSAIHHLSIFTKKSEATRMLTFVTNTEQLPPGDEQGDIGDIEINFRNVPTTHDGQNLTVVNTQPSVPDVYGA